MAQSSYPFASQPTSEVQFEQIMSDLQSSGVGGGAGPGDDNLAVVATGTAQVQVKPGRAFVHGFEYISTSAETVNLSANSSGLTRIDTIVLRRDLSADSILITAKTGTPASSPVAPAPIQNEGGIWELVLAQVTVPSGASAPSVNNLQTYVGRQVIACRTATRPQGVAGQVIYDVDIKQYLGWYSSDNGASGWRSMNGVTQCTSSSRPSNPLIGQLILETDTGRRRTWNGSSWKYIGFVGGRLDANAPWAQFSNNGAQINNNTAEFVLPGSTWTTNRGSAVVSKPLNNDGNFRVNETGLYQLQVQGYSDYSSQGNQTIRVNVTGAVQPMTDVRQRNQGYTGAGVIDSSLVGTFFLYSGDTFSVQVSQNNTNNAAVSLNVNLAVTLIG